MTLRLSFAESGPKEFGLQVRLLQTFSVNHLQSW